VKPALVMRNLRRSWLIPLAAENATTHKLTSSFTIGFRMVIFIRPEAVNCKSLGASTANMGESSSTDDRQGITLSLCRPCKSAAQPGSRKLVISLWNKAPRRTDHLLS
jgi:hypothetical protein